MGLGNQLKDSIIHLESSLKEQMKKFRQADREFDSVLRPDSPSFIDKSTWISRREHQQLIQDSNVAVKMTQNSTKKGKEESPFNDIVKKVKEKTKAMDEE